MTDGAAETAAAELNRYEKRLQTLQREAKDFEDYMSEDSDVDENADAQEKEKFLKDFSTCVVVDNLPKIPMAKYDKLCNVVRKLFSRMGNIVELEMPQADDNQTAGCAFIEFETVEEAEKAIKNVNNFALDKRHTLLVNAFEDIEKYSNTPETYVEPKEEEFTPQQDLKKWLADERGRDMFVLRYDTETELHWSENGRTALEYDGENEKQNGKQWCSQYVSWSPHGTYLATFHPQGIAIWGGETFEKLGRFAHKGVKVAVFSPEEKYLLTCNEIEGDAGIIVWEVRTGKMLRAFGLKPGQGNIIPYRWSHDGQFVAKRGTDVISVYETPSMKLVGNKSLKAISVNNFFWSPMDNLIAYWAPEGNNSPARVCLVEMPSRHELRRKNLFNVSDCKLHWHPNGNYLCVNVTRHSKSKKTQYTNFELFRIREQLVPVEMIEMKEPIVAFAWEPKGTRFAVCHGEGTQRLSVSFYDMCGGKKQNEVTLLYTLKDKCCNHLYWSPQGNYIVMAGLGEMNGILEFWNADEQQSLAEQEHFKCSHVEWDPSGRIVSTAVCQPLDSSYYKFQMDNGYSLWTFQGKNLLEQRKDKFYQILWRPRPKSLLSDKEYANVVKNIKSYERKYAELDRKKEQERIDAEKAAKEKLRTDFIELVEKRRAAFNSRRAELVELCGGYDSESDDLYEKQTETHDEIISETEEIIKA